MVEMIRHCYIYGNVNAIGVSFHRFELKYVETLNVNPNNINPNSVLKTSFPNKITSEHQLLCVRFTMPDTMKLNEHDSEDNFQHVAIVEFHDHSFRKWYLRLSTPIRTDTTVRLNVVAVEFTQNAVRNEKCERTLVNCRRRKYSRTVKIRL